MQHNFDQEGYGIVESDNTPAYHSRGAAARHGNSSRVRGSLGGLKIYLGALGVIILGFVLWVSFNSMPGLWLYIGLFAAFCAVVLLLCGLAWAIISTLRHATRADYVEMGEFGGYYRNALGRVTPLAPMIAAPTKVNKATAKVEIVPEVPTLFDLIDAGEIAPGQLQMVMGYDKAQLLKGILQLIVGPWPGTHAVAGKGRSGKTRRVIGEIAQALIGGARVIVCDPHFTKPDSLARALEPLEKYITIARGEAEILTATREFMSEMYARQDSAEHVCSPWLIIYDEWSRLMNPNNSKIDEDGRELLKEAALRCSTEFAGYLGYCCLIGQIWTNEAAGGTDVRRSLQSVFIHQLSAEYAQFFVRAAKWKNRVEELKRRECIYKDNDNQIMEILTIGVPDDTANRVAVYLAAQGFPAINAPASESAPRLPEYQERPRLQGYAGEPAPLELPAPGLSPAQDIHPDYSYSRLPGFTSGESENVVNAPIDSGEAFTDMPPLGERLLPAGETFTARESAPSYTREQETAILKAAYQIARETGKLTRSDIKERLGWNNKMYPVLKAVCDAHGIA